MSRTTLVLVVPSLFALLFGLGVVRQTRLESQLEEGLRQAQTNSGPGHDDLDALRKINERLRGFATGMSALQQRTKVQTKSLGQVRELEEELAKLQRDVTESRRVHSLWQGQAAELSEQERSELDELRELVQQQQLALDGLNQERQQTLVAQQHEWDRLREQFSDQANREGEASLQRWEHLLGPSVQVSGNATVGSGVLLCSRPRSDGGWRTHVLTAWHVVRDLFDQEREGQPNIPINIYEQDGSFNEHFAKLLTHDASIDVALLELDTREHVPHGVRLPSREKLEGVSVFDRIYAVGCPLGNDPIPTLGEVASVAHPVSGETYWMISAPTYIGNSGGGIFDAETHELLGLFSKIYTHGSLRSTIIPHMGLVMPLEEVYDWFEEEGYVHLSLDSQFASPEAASFNAKD